MKGSTVNIKKGSTLNAHAQKAKSAHEKRSEGPTRVQTECLVTFLNRPIDVPEFPFASVS